MVRDVAYNAETDDFTVTVKDLEKDEVNRCLHNAMFAALSFRARICKRLRSPGIVSASLCSLAGWYDRTITLYVVPARLATYIGWWYRFLGIDSWSP